MQCIRECDDTFLYIFQRTEVTDRSYIVNLVLERTKTKCNVDDSTEIFIYVIDIISDKVVVLAIVDPNLDHACLISNLTQFCKSYFEVIDLINYVESLEKGVLSNDEAYKNAVKVFDSIVSALSSNPAASYQIREYASLYELGRDPFVDVHAKVYKYCNHFYTKSSSAEFSLRKAKVSEGFLREHCTNIGYARAIKEVFT